MSTTEVLMAGFGGQGMLLSGKLLAHAAMEVGMEVSWLPSYGPEMRGGTANVTVCVSDRPVGSPYILRPSALLVMNRPSLEKFGPRVKPGGRILVNSSLIHVPANRDDCQVMYLDAVDVALKLGTARAANLVMLGTYVAWSDLVDHDVAVRMIEKEFARKPKFVPINVSAFEAGYARGVEQRGEPS